jgi:hypothetical protein
LHPKRVIEHVLALADLRVKMRAECVLLLALAFEGGDCSCFLLKGELVGAEKSALALLLHVAGALGGRRELGECGALALMRVGDVGSVRGGGVWVGGQTGALVLRRGVDAVVAEEIPLGGRRCGARRRLGRSKHTALAGAKRTGTVDKGVAQAPVSLGGRLMLMFLGRAPRGLRAARAAGKRGGAFGRWGLALGSEHERFRGLPHTERQRFKDHVQMDEKRARSATSCGRGGCLPQKSSERSWDGWSVSRINLIAVRRRAEAAAGERE